MKAKRLRWFGHVERREDDKLVKKISELVVEDSLGRDRKSKK